VPGRASVLFVLALAPLPALSACNHDGPEDPAIAPSGTGIPVGAVGAVGVSFDTPSLPPAPSTLAGEALPPRRGGATRPHRPPPDPFAEPPDPSGADGPDGGSAARPPSGGHRPGKHSGGTAL
jgi:hypothetical protein